MRPQRWPRLAVIMVVITACGVAITIIRSVNVPTVKPALVPTQTAAPPKPTATPIPPPPTATPAPLAACRHDPANIPALPTGNTFHTCGAQILNADGTPVRITGVSWFG